MLLGGCAQMLFCYELDVTLWKPSQSLNGRTNRNAEDTEQNGSSWKSMTKWPKPQRPLNRTRPFLIRLPAPRKTACLNGNLANPNRRIGLHAFMHRKDVLNDRETCWHTGLEIASLHKDIRNKDGVWQD